VKIDGYSFGRIVINGTVYDSDVIICPDRVIDNWWREEGHSLSLKDLESVLMLQFDCLVIGTGMYGMMDVPNALHRDLTSRGIELVVASTGEACKRYNRIVSKDNTTIGAFHLTC
jgi:hypothetical protein